MCARVNKEPVFLSLECGDFLIGFFFDFEMPLELNPDNTNSMEIRDKLKKKEGHFGILFAV